MISQVGMRRKKPWVAIVLVAVIVIAGVSALLLYMSGSAPTSPIGNSGVAVERGDINRTVYGSGIIEPANTVSLYAPTDARIDALNVEQGDSVKQGDQIAVLSSSLLDTKISDYEHQLTQLNSKISSSSKGESSVIKAPVAGRVKIIHVKKEDRVEAVMNDVGALCVLSADGLMKVDIATNERVKVGAKVSLLSDSKTVEGTVVAIKQGRITAAVDDKHFSANTNVSVKDEYGAVLGQGNLYISTPVTVIGNQGRIESISVSENENVSKGGTLFSLKDSEVSSEYLQMLSDREKLLKDLKEAKEKLDHLVVIAPYDGVINALTLSEKDQLREDQLLCKLEQAGQFEVVVDIDELDISNIGLGQTAQVKAAALNYKPLSATVTGISGVGKSVNGVTNYEAKLLLSDATGIYSGMSANADVLVESKQNVLVIPINALKMDGASPYATLITATGKTDVPVEVGIVNGTKAEILSGLNQGDRVESVNTGSGDLMESMMANQQRMQGAMFGN